MAFATPNTHTNREQASVCRLVDLTMSRHGRRPALLDKKFYFGFIYIETMHFLHRFCRPSCARISGKCAYRKPARNHVSSSVPKPLQPAASCSEVARTEHRVGIPKRARQGRGKCLHRLTCRPVVELRQGGRRALLRSKCNELRAPFRPTVISVCTGSRCPDGGGR